jgi:transposase
VIETLKNKPKNELISIISDQQNILSQKETEIERLNHQIKYFQKIVYGPKKETHKTIAHPSQGELPFTEKVDLDLKQDQERININYSRNKAKGKRTDFSKLELPADLEEVVVIIEPEHIPDGSVKIDEERTELLACRPAEFYKKVIIRPKYGLPGGEGVIIGQLPSRIIPGGKVDESFLRMILIDKYIFHMPLYRQLIKYAQMGVKISDATIGDWTAKTIIMLNFLYERLIIRIRGSNYLQADETTVKVLDKKTKGKTHLGYYWVYHAVKEKVVVFNYQPGRDHGAPMELLEGFEGDLQTDGFSAYTTLIKKQPLIDLVGCMAHSRRHYFDAQDFDKVKSVWMLDRLQELYAIERIAREGNFTDDERLTLRQEKSVPILNVMKPWVDEQIEIDGTTNPLTKALRYMSTRWEKLILFTTDGKLEIDNNLVENAIRPIALGRRNWLFAGSTPAAQRGGVIYSLFATCKLNGIDPDKWLLKVLQKLPDKKQSELDTLLPLPENAHFARIIQK